MSLRVNPVSSATLAKISDLVGGFLDFVAMKN
jgi:hypothetical protein